MSKSRKRSRKKKIFPWKLLATAALVLLALAGVFLRGYFDQPAWKNNLCPVENPITVVWSYRPLTYACPKGVDVLSPTWFYVEEEDGSAVLHDLGQMGQSWDGAAYVQSAHADGVKVWITVVSFQPELSNQLVSEEKAQKAFIAQLASKITDLGADGICFDFEKMDPADKELFTALVGKAKAALGEKTVTVAVTVPVNDDTNWYQCYDRAGLAQAADYLALMSYDAHKEAMQPVAPVNWVENAVERTLAMVPSDRVLLGIPFYGVDFALPEGESAQAQAITVYQLDALLAGQPVKMGGSTVQAAAWQVCGQWQEEYGTALWQYTDTSGTAHQLWIENEDSLKEKTALMRHYCLAGCAVWRQSQGNDALWQGLARAMEQREEK